MRFDDITAAENQDVRLIDLEKLKWMPSRQHIRRGDLARIIRRAAPMNRTDLKTLIDSYLSTNKDLSDTPLAEELQHMLDKQFNPQE